MQMVKILPKKGQPIYCVYDTTGAAPTDTVVFEVKFRAVDVTVLGSIDMSLRDGGTRAYRFYFSIYTDKAMKGRYFNNPDSKKVVEGVGASATVGNSCTYANSSAIDSASVIFSGDNKDVVDMCDFYFGYKAADAE